MRRGLLALLLLAACPVDGRPGPDATCADWHEYSAHVCSYRDDEASCLQRVWVRYLECAAQEENRRAPAPAPPKPPERSL